MHWANFLKFADAHSAVIVAFFSAIGVAIGWCVTWRSWTVSREASARLEADRHAQAIDLEKLRAELHYVSEQIRLLYGPLTALCETRAASFIALMQKNAPGRQYYFDGNPRTPEDLRVWRLWRNVVFMPLILQMEQALLLNSHLVSKDNFPQSHIDFLTHVAAYKVIVREWADIVARDEAEGTDKILSADYGSAQAFPEDFQADVTRTFCALKARQEELIRRELLLSPANAASAPPEPSAANARKSSEFAPAPERSAS
ncbi:hypothetical protein [Caballeronia sp. LZ035]|uniref:hypothetical protein n=1 Tax=Caballeronia sp. LZ035 TaxID=3038568 RepID=UPI0028541DBF|nr:hypothetical protein [Caballeronia sp. LZ035]MDR5757119.1 hypothetical protein [Caballeronia sp. LZ035]